MNFSRWIRQLHRWLSMAFTFGVIAYVVVMQNGTPPAWVGLLALVPLLNLSLVCKEMLSGVWHWNYIALIFGSSCVYAAVALALALAFFTAASAGCAPPTPRAIPTTPPVTGACMNSDLISLPACETGVDRFSDEACTVLDDALTRLAAVKPDHAKLIELRYFAGRTADEAATALGGFDAVIVTAGLFATQEMLEEDPALAERVLSVDFTGTVLFSSSVSK